MTGTSSLQVNVKASINANGLPTNSKQVLSCSDNENTTSLTAHIVAEGLLSREDDDPNNQPTGSRATAPGSEYGHVLPEGLPSRKTDCCGTTGDAGPPSGPRLESHLHRSVPEGLLSHDDNTATASQSPSSPPPPPLAPGLSQLRLVPEGMLSREGDDPESSGGAGAQPRVVPEGMLSREENDTDG